MWCWQERKDTGSDHKQVSREQPSSKGAYSLDSSVLRSSWESGEGVEKAALWMMKPPGRFGEQHFSPQPWISARCAVPMNCSGSQEKLLSLQILGNSNDIPNFFFKPISHAD